MVTSNLLSVNSPDYLLFKHNWLDWTKTNGRKGRRQAWFYPGGEVKPVLWMWLNPAAHENLCASLRLPASLESGGSCEQLRPMKLEEITVVTFGPVDI